MPRKYAKKMKEYTEKTVQTAIAALNNGSSLRGTAITFNIPKSTLKTAFDKHKLLLAPSQGDSSIDDADNRVSR